MSILQVRDKNGNIIDIPALRGKSAYQYAQEGGFKGTEAEFTEKIGSNWVTEDDLGDLDLSGTVEVTSDNPTRSGTVMTIDPNPKNKINLYSAEEVDHKFNNLSGTVEVTSGNPDKAGTVLTIDPNAKDEVNIYSAEEVDYMLNELSKNIGNGGGTVSGGASVQFITWEADD